MLRRILVALDGSRFAESATELAVRWARATSAQLTGLGVIDEPELCAPEPVPIGGGAFKVELDQSRLKEAQRAIEAAVQRFEQRCREQGVACRGLVDVGLPSQQITREAQRADLIFLGQETHFLLDGEPGRTLHAVLKAPPRPVVVVPEQLPQGNAVVVAYDGSLQATRALWAFCQMGLPALFDSVHLLTVHEEEGQGRLIAQYAAELLEAHAVECLPEILAPSQAVDQLILHAAQQHQAGLIVMGCYGKASLMEWFLGTTTVNVIARSVFPLFLFQ